MSAAPSAARQTKQTAPMRELRHELISVRVPVGTRFVKHGSVDQVVGQTGPPSCTNLLLTLPLSTGKTTVALYVHRANSSALQGKSFQATSRTLREVFAEDGGVISEQRIRVTSGKLPGALLTRKGSPKDIYQLLAFDNELMIHAAWGSRAGQPNTREVLRILNSITLVRDPKPLTQDQRGTVH
jgi:hypothetical protein